MPRPLQQPPAVPETEHRKHFLARVRDRFLLRGHMTAIVLGTTLSGVGANALLFHLGVTYLWARCLLAVVAAYLVFLGLVRLWLAAMTHGKWNLENVAEGADLISFEVDTSPVPFSGEGGQFGGGGASASFDAGNPPRWEELSVSQVGESKSGSWLSGFDIDGEGLVLLIAFLVLITTFVCVGGYLIWDAPVILAETLFEFSLASAVVRKLKRTERSDWLGHLMKLTWIPFAAVFAVTALFCGLVLFLRPSAERIVDILNDAPPAITPR